MKNYLRWMTRSSGTIANPAQRRAQALGGSDLETRIRAACDDAKKRTFHLHLNKCIQKNEGMVARVIREMNLPPDTATESHPDSHHSNSRVPSFGMDWWGDTHHPMSTVLVAPGR